MRVVRHVVATVAIALLVPAASLAKLRVAASVNDLASIAATVGGDRVESFSIARPKADVHRVEVLPSYMVRVAKADLYLKVGLGLDRWADGIIAGSRNQRLRIVDCSQNVEILEKPTGKVTAALGDIHPDGNPHYWLDPRNGARIAKTIAEVLAAADPAHAQEFHARAEAFGRECEAHWKQGLGVVQAMPVKVAITYHRSWSYLANAFGFEVAGTVEPVPGIPPTAKHLAGLLRIVKERRVPVLIQEPYFSAEAGKFLKRQSNLRIVLASASCDSPQPGAYLAHIAGVLRELGGAS